MSFITFRKIIDFPDVDINYEMYNSQRELANFEIIIPKELVNFVGVLTFAVDNCEYRNTLLEIQTNFWQLKKQNFF